MKTSSEPPRGLVPPHTGRPRALHPWACRHVEQKFALIFDVVRHAAGQREIVQFRGGPVAVRLSDPEEWLVRAATIEERVEIEADRAHTEERPLQVRCSQPTKARSVQLMVTYPERTPAKVGRHFAATSHPDTLAHVPLLL